MSCKVAEADAGVHSLVMAVAVSFILQILPAQYSFILSVACNELAPLRYGSSIMTKKPPSYRC
jgi:hypothetical protein